MKKFFFAFSLIFLFSVFQFAQTPTPTPDTEDVVKISTTLIQVDVTVTDKKGNLVKDLKPEEIEIYENGKKQEVTNFSFISSVREKIIEPTGKSPSANIPVAPPSPVRPEQVRRTIALVVDDLTLSFRSINDTQRALKKFVDEQMRDGDLVAIIRTGAGIGALQQFTTDRRQLYAAIEKISFNPAGNGGIATFSPIEPSPYDESATGGRLSPPTFDTESTRASIFAVGTLGAINFVVRGMQELPGRKSIMLFSEGFALYTKDKNDFRDSTRVFDALQKLVDAANRASVVIYTMDARGLQTTGLTAADDLVGKTSAEIQQSVTDRNTQLVETQEGLLYLAEQTGGIASINNNDLEGGIRKMIDDQSYYLIGYQPDDETFDPQKRNFNKLEIKVKRENVKVRYRSGFFGISDEQIAAQPKVKLTPKQKISDALTSPFAVNDISLRLNAIFGNEGKSGAYIRSFLHIGTENIKFADTSDGKKKATFSILAVGYGDNGTAIESVNKTFTATVKESDYKIIKENGFIYDFLFPVKKPGAYQLRVAVYDVNSEKVGSANQFLEVPNIDKKNLLMSGIVVQSLSYSDWKKTTEGQKPDTETNPVGDTALRQFKAGTVLSYGTVIYNPKISTGGKPDLKIRARLFRDGKMIFEGKEQSVLTDGIKDMQRISASGSLNLGTEMSLGDYILQIVVTDNPADKKRQTVSQFVPFEIIK